MKRTALQRKTPLGRGTSQLRRTPFERTSPLQSSSMTLAELREARGAPSLVRKSGLRADPEKTRAWQNRSRKELKPNRRRQARRALNYRRVIASDFHKRLRYDAFVRSGGLCECERCVEIRKVWGVTLFTATDVSQPYTVSDVWAATNEIPVWFTKRGGEPWRRFRSTDGEVHHDSYKFFGDENPAELEHVRWTWKSCHRRIEQQFGTRRKFLSGKAA